MSADWFVVNIAEAPAIRAEGYGAAVRFEGAERFPEFGINVRVLQPGEYNCLYHRENAQECFLVLSGECLAIVEEEERPMGKGDFLYTPPGVAHVIVGAGTGPCSVLMAGTRPAEDQVEYPVSPAAARHGASVQRETSDPKEAYAGRIVEQTTVPLPW